MQASLHENMAARLNKGRKTESPQAPVPNLCFTSDPHTVCA